MSGTSPFSFPTPVTFRDFMETALYDREHGFYGTGRVKFGPGGDFATSSHLTPLFGELLARWLDARRGELGEPFTIVELGAGTGLLARDILSWLRDNARLPRRYVVVERSEALVAAQRELLAGFSGTVEWLAPGDFHHERFGGVVLSNEFFDALPTHHVRRRGSELQEWWVSDTPVTGQLTGSWGQASSDRLAEYLDRYADPTSFAAGHWTTVEVCLEALEWIDGIAGALDQGHVLTIDYGDVASRLYGGRREAGTLRAFRDRRLCHDLLADPGRQDLTAHVNFTALIERGREVGLELVALMTQEQFLESCGLAQVIAARTPTASLQERLAWKSLIGAGGPSAMLRALVQRRAV